MKSFKSFMVLPLILLSACTPKPDPKEEYLKLYANMADYDSYHISGEGELDMDIPIDPDNPDSTIGLTMPFTMDINANGLNQTMNMDLTFTLSIVGQTIDYNFYIRDQYVYLDVMGQKGAVPMNETLRTMLDSIYTFNDQLTRDSLDDSNLKMTLTQNQDENIITMIMDMAYFENQMEKMTTMFGEENTSFDQIENIEFNIAIHYRNNQITSADINGFITISAMPIDVNLTLQFDGYDMTKVVPITPSDYPITPDGTVETTIPFDQMV